MCTAKALNHSRNTYYVNMKLRIYLSRSLRNSLPNERLEINQCRPAFVTQFVLGQSSIQKDYNLSKLDWICPIFCTMFVKIILSFLYLSVKIYCILSYVSLFYIIKLIVRQLGTIIISMRSHFETEGCRSRSIRRVN